MPSTESHYQSEDAYRVRYWRSEAKRWEQRATDLAEEVDALKYPCRIVFEQTYKGKVAERSIYKASEDVWQNVLTRLPFLKSWPSIVHCGIVFAIDPFGLGIPGVPREIQRQNEFS